MLVVVESCEILHLSIDVELSSFKRMHMHHASSFHLTFFFKGSTNADEAQYH